MYARLPSHASVTGDIGDRICLRLEGGTDRFVAAGGTVRPNRNLLGTAGIVLTMVHTLASVTAYPLQMLSLFFVFHNSTKLLSEFL